jgi:hypothetical protein
VKRTLTLAVYLFKTEGKEGGAQEEMTVAMKKGQVITALVTAENEAAK